MKTKRVLVWVVIASCLCTGGLVAQQTDPDLTTSGKNPPAASQPVPRLIMFSGTVQDLTGKPLAGPVDLSFAIYKEQTDAAPLWQESQTLNLDEQGHYTALLGATQPGGLPTELFTTGEARWLGVSAGTPSASSGQGLPEQPRTLLVSVPYALKSQDAEMLAGKPASAYALAQPAEGTTTTGPLAGGATSPRGAASSDLATPGNPKSGAKPNLAGTQYYIPRWTDSAGTLGNSAMYQGGSDIGVGTTSPTFTLDVNGNALAIGTKTARAGYGGSVRLRDDTGTQRWSFGIPGSSGATAFFVSDAVNGTQPLFIEAAVPSNSLYLKGSTGNVGIHTTTPAFTLDVNGNTLAIGTTTAHAGNGGSVRLRDDTGTQRWSFGIPGSSGATGFFVSDAVNGTQPLFIEAAAPSYSFYLKGTTGNVGIGTATPAQKLDVKGNINTSGNVTATGSVTAASFAGGGAGLTSVNAANLTCSGCVSASELDFTAATQTGLSAEATARAGADTTLQSTLNSEASTRSSRDQALSVRGINYLAGCDSCIPLVDGDDQAKFYVNVVGSMTITSVTCFSDAGSPVINLQRDDGSPANVLASDLTCSPAGVTFPFPS
jgi:hypothetical protein